MYDLTLPLTSCSPAYPGDIPLSINTSSIQTTAGSILTSDFYCSCHLGTHIDFPSHMGFAKNSSDYTIEQLCEQGMIIDIPADIDCVKAEQVPVLFWSSQKRHLI